MTKTNSDHRSLTAERRRVLLLVAPLLEKQPYEAVLAGVTNLVLDEIEAAVAEVTAERDELRKKIMMHDANVLLASHGIDANATLVEMAKETMGKLIAAEKIIAGEAERTEAVVLEERRICQERTDEANKTWAEAANGARQAGHTDGVAEERARWRGWLSWRLRIESDPAPDK